MPSRISLLLQDYIEELKKIYKTQLKQVILYGSYARGDFNDDSDIDIMVLVNLTDLELKEFQDELSDMTYDFNMDHDLDIKPIAKSRAHFLRWVKNYPFYANVQKDGVSLYGVA